MRSEIELRLPPEPIAPILARAAVAAIGSGLPGSVVSDAELLTSEVVSNAVKHADLDPSQEIVLRVVMDERLRIRSRILGRRSKPTYGDRARTRVAGDCS